MLPFVIHGNRFRYVSTADNRILVHYKSLFHARISFLDSQWELHNRQEYLTNCLAMETHYPLSTIILRPLVLSQ